MASPLLLLGQAVSSIKGIGHEQFEEARGRFAEKDLLAPLQLAECRRRQARTDPEQSAEAGICAHKIAGHFFLDSVLGQP